MPFEPSQIMISAPSSRPCGRRLTASVSKDALVSEQEDLASVFPTAEEYHAAPGEGRNRVYTGDEFGGIIPFPFPTVALCRLVVHDKLTALAEAVFGTGDIRVYAGELWAKYSGAAGYEARPAPSWPTARTRSTGVRRSPRRVRPGSAPTSATSTRTTHGPAATRGAIIRSTRTGTRSWRRRRRGSCCFSASRRPATRTGRPRLSLT